MNEKKNGLGVELMDIQIGVTIVLCLLLCHAANQMGLQVEAMVVSTGALMCVQDSAKAAYQTSLIRILGVFCGGLTGVGIALLDTAIGIPFVFYLLCGVGVVTNLILCKFLKMAYVQARVSCLTLLLVVLVTQGADRVGYALSRFVGSLVGALVALLVTMIFAVIVRKAKKEAC